MTFQPIEELSVAFDSTSATTRLRRRRRAMRSRLVSLVITVALLVGLYLWKGDQITGPGFVALSSAVLAISVGWFVACLVAYLRAKRDLAAVGTGIALRIGRRGVELSGTCVPWSEVQSLAAVKGRLGRSPQLRLLRTNGETRAVPFDQIDVRPATLDTTARAYSAGRHGVDLEALET
jgi:hypothetical protein